MSIIDITFTGTAFAIMVEYTPEWHQIGGYQPYTANFVFDTSLGVLSDHRLDGGLVEASITTDMFGTWGGGPFAFYGAPWLTWDDALNSVTAVAAPASTNSLWATTDPYGGRYGSFQFGNCPSSYLGPCGYLKSVDSMTVIGLPLAVPAPILGSGISSLLLVLVISAIVTRQPLRGSKTSERF